MNFVEMARGMGVEASMAITASEFHAQVTEAMAFDGPRLIHMCVTGSGHLE
jgi:thiamine pyrophosphate-dependent acetolactate synthase large subunit-like protein